MSALRLNPHWISLASLLVVAVAMSDAQADTRTIDQHQAADPSGTLEIVNVAGSIKVVGWDKPEVEVAGEIGDRVERVDITGTDKHLTIKVVLPVGGHWSGDGDAHLTIHVPQMSTLFMSLVSSDLKISGVSGPQQIHSVSGKVVTDAGGGQRISTISGDVEVSVPPGTPAEVSTVSGDVSLRGAEGDVSVKTVSGSGQLNLGTISHFRLESVSGDFKISAHLATGAEFEASGVSSDFHTEFTGAPGATFDLSSLSGEISNCTDPQATRPRIGPGTHLNYTSGDGKASVKISSKSGELSLCSK